MARAKEKPLYDPPADYEDDGYLWALQQADLLRKGRFSEADIPNIVEELETMGRSERAKLRSSYRLIISHLLKWEFQPRLRSRSWLDTIQRERTNVEDNEAENRSLAASADQVVEDAWRGALREAMRETGLPRSVFPAECPYPPDRLRDFDFFPGPALPFPEIDRGES